MGSGSLSRTTDTVPHARLLSNGRYTVVLTGAGTGFSTWNGCALTHWAGDRTEDRDGFFLYVRDLDRQCFWSAGHQPVRAGAERYEARYEPGRFVIERAGDGIEMRLEVCVAPGDDLELRRLWVCNRSDRVRHFELTTYAEVVAGARAAHAAHPAFSKLFVETEVVPEAAILLAHRRARAHGEHHPWLVHSLPGAGAAEWETDRSRFLGRRRSPAAPRALTALAPLSGTAGSVLDPVFSLRRSARLMPGEATELAAMLGVAPTRAAALDLIGRYRDAPALQRAFEAASEQERATVRRLSLTEDRAEYWQEVAGRMLYGDPALRVDDLGRAPAQISHRARYGIRADALLVLVYVSDADHRQLVRDVLAAIAYWRTKALEVDVRVVCAASPASLPDDCRRWLAEAGGDASRFLLQEEIPPPDLAMLRAAAHLVVDAKLPRLADRGAAARQRDASTAFEGDGAAARVAVNAPNQESLRCWNGYGGFSGDGTEYVVPLDAIAPPLPMPWVNVVANETFGFLASETGAGYTWSRNSRENRLSPWSNDPVGDPHSEALYLRDEESGACWSPLPGPAPGPGRYEARHGFGYSRWHYDGEGIEHQVEQFVPRHEPVKVTRVRLVNTTDRVRRLSFCAYHRLVLGELPGESGRFVVTEFDAAVTALLARNALNNEFLNGVVFAAIIGPDGHEPVRYTGDRTAFIGRNGDLGAPAALRPGGELDGRTGSGLDPCAALQISLSIPPGAAVECAVLFGEAGAAPGARALIERYRDPGARQRALDTVRAFWTDTLSAVHVDTPSADINLMLNGWLLYQTLSCRLWGRSAFYQSGGAFGFRDQLQDAAALVYARPDLTRAQILLHAAHQFVEGDVLHWWHPPIGRGIRTRFSDDLLWLPFVTAFYVQRSGDWALLDESVGFVTARSLEPGEDETYLLPVAAAERADLYSHCCRALDRSLTRGAHGLPLMGTGDWNDGMNRVGREGRGESVWLGFFLCKIIDDFVPLCERRGDADRIRRYRAYQSTLRVALEDAGWDGDWYRRAYYDDGSPLGSAQNEEGRIDALVQAWAVISNAAARQHAARAMDAVEQHLLSRDAGLIRLLAPPFDRDLHDPGYIKGYVPGIRENGGQYTHAAVWVVQALAELGRRDRAAAYLEMLGPIHHSRTPQDVATYQVEPYVVAADIYGVAPHVGRGGWTWYTGSAGWMYRVGIESILGLRLRDGDTLHLEPHVPDDWPEFKISWRLPDRETRYEITVRNPNRDAAAVLSLTIDGAPGLIEHGAACIPLRRDGAQHHIEVLLGPKGS